MKRYRLLGIMGAVIAYPFILASIFLSPWFNIFNNALSDLGNTELNGLTAWVFNTGLGLSGLLTSLFSVILSLRNRSWRYWGWSILLVASGIDLALIGVFPENAGRIHTTVSTVFFMLLVITMLAYSFCSWLLSSPHIGLAALVFGVASLIVWFVEWPWNGVAIQETVTSLMSAIWLIMVARRNLKDMPSLKS